MVNTVTRNIQMFLRDKPLWMPFALETVDKDFPVFWEKIKAKGDYRAAVAEFEIRHNSSLSLGI